MDVKHGSSSSSAQERLIPVLLSPTPVATPAPSVQSPSTPSTVDGEDAPEFSSSSSYSLLRTSKSRAPLGRNPRRADNDEPPLFWVHMDQQSAVEGTRENILKRIRSHVMSEHNRKKRLEGSRRYKTKAWKRIASQPVSRPGASGHAESSHGDLRARSSNTLPAEPVRSSAFPLGVLGFPLPPATETVSGVVDANRTTSALQTPWTHLGTGANDPFFTTHTPLSNRMAWHLQYFLHALTRKAYPFHQRCGPKLQRHWETLIRHDPAPLHAAICLASLNSGVAVGAFPLDRSKDLWSSALVVDTFHHRGETIKLVNKDLSDPTKASSDELIATVSLLLTTEVASGNPDYLKIHLAGLRQMVALRQSFSDLLGDIRFQISWTDLRVAAMAMTKPIFPAIRCPRPLNLIIGAPSENLSATASRLLSLDRAWGVFGNAMSRAIYDLLELVWYTEWVKTYSANEDFDEETEEYFNTEVVYVEHCLHADRYNEYGRAKGDNTIEGCIRLACLLFHNTLVWDFYPMNAAVMPKPIVALKIALETSTQAGLFSECPDLLIWLLFIGDCAAGALDEKVFFRRVLRSAMRNRGIVNWQQLREMLMTFFYVDRCYLGDVQSAWDDPLW